MRKEKLYFHLLWQHTYWSRLLPHFGFAGQNTHFLLSLLVKHLDHKNVLKKPSMQLDIVEVTTSLARHAKVESSVAIIGAVSDVMRHLRKSIHCSIDDENLGADIIKWNRKFQETVDECLVQLSYKVSIHFLASFSNCCTWYFVAIES